MNNDEWRMTVVCFAHFNAGRGQGLAAARSRRGSDSPVDCHARPRQPCATPPYGVGYMAKWQTPKCLPFSVDIEIEICYSVCQHSSEILRGSFDCVGGDNAGIRAAGVSGDDGDLCIIGCAGLKVRNCIGIRISIYARTKQSICCGTIVSANWCAVRSTNNNLRSTNFC